MGGCREDVQVPATDENIDREAKVLPIKRNAVTHAVQLKCTVSTGTAVTYCNEECVYTQPRVIK